MTTTSDSADALSRPTDPLSSFQAARLRFQMRLQALPPRRVGAFAVALLVGGATWSILNAARTSQAQWGDLLTVLVAVEVIEPGEELTLNNTEVRALPLALLPRGAVTDERRGQLATAPIGVGQIIIEGQIGVDRHGLQPDRRAITLPQPLATPALTRGDIVDLISVRATQSSVAASSLGTAQVVQVTDHGITVVVDQHITATVFEALASGSVEFARRPTQR